MNDTRVSTKRYDLTGILEQKLVDGGGAVPHALLRGAIERPGGTITPDGHCDEEDDTGNQERQHLLLAVPPAGRSVDVSTVTPSRVRLST
jgi:hypothetical protein